jgi:hypothetical protein
MFSMLQHIDHRDSSAMTTDYIADLLHVIRTARIPDRAPKYKHSDLFGFCEGVRVKGRDLEGRELYAFDLSALNAASDLRIDTPDRVDRLVGAVLQEPRRIFIEASASDMAVINKNLRGLLSPWSGVKSDRVRWGAFVDVHGDGRATYQHVTMIPSELLKDEPEYGPVRDAARQMEGAASSMVPQAMRLRISPAIGDLDVSRHVGMSRSEFDQAFQRISSGSDPIARYAADLLKTETRPRRRGQIMDEAWRALRFRDIVRTIPSGDPANASDELDALRNGLPIIAMLAVLSADADDLKAQPRSRAKRGAKSGSSAPKSKDLAPGLKVVTLNLEDREMQKIYNSQASSAPAVSHEHTDMSSRVRHPVRGHLFLARNGKMTWRKPHWRGTLERPVLKRVVAPSHH